jgi:sec-independent protein translocase protein TatB
MLDMSWGEVMVIGGVALIVIGPKDLPKALRTVGQITGKLRRMAGEFHTQFNDAMREADLDDVRKDLESINRNVAASTATGFNPIQTIRDELKGAVDGRPVTATTHLSDTSAPTEIMPSSPELAIADTVSTEAHADPLDEGPLPPRRTPAPGAALPEAAMPAEEVGAPPAIVPREPEAHHTHASSTPMDVTGPGLEGAAAPAPVNATHQGDRA